MDLIKLLDEGDFIGIIYPNTKYKSIRSTLIKNLSYNNSNDTVVLFENRGDTITLNYLNVEDPANPGDTFGTLEELWDYIISIIGAGGASYPSVIEDGNTVAWYIADDLSTITKDGSDFVSQWDDKLGSGHDLIQSTGVNQPKWVVNDGILFDRSNANFLKTVPFTLNMPNFVYIVFKQITWTQYDWIFDGDGQQSNSLYQRGTTPQLMAVGGTLSPPISLTLDTYGIVRVLFNGASSKLILNDNTPVTWDFGTAQAGGFTLGSSGTGAFPSDIQVKEIIVRKVADVAQDESDIYNYLKTRYEL